MNGNRMLIAFKCLYGLNCFFGLEKQRPGLLYRNSRRPSVFRLEISIYIRLSARISLL